MLICFTQVKKICQSGKNSKEQASEPVHELQLCMKCVTTEEIRLAWLLLRQQSLSHL